MLSVIILQQKVYKLIFIYDKIYLMSIKRFLLSIIVILGSRAVANNSFQSISQVGIDYNKQKALLGKILFMDPKLSKDGTVACVKCHNLTTNGADTTAYSIGVYGKKGSANSPTVFNSALKFRLMWNGRAKSLKDQVLLPLYNPVEMGMNKKQINSYLKKNPFYNKKFKAIYHRPANIDDMSDAIAEFEKALITPNSRFDQFLDGKLDLNPLEKKGFELFKYFGCINCHNGVNLGGNSFQKMGIFHTYNRTKNTPDLFAITNHFSDKNIYWTPGLRNIAITAPYFHDGSSKTLEDALKKMSYHNLGIKLKSKDIKALIAFLKTLTGEKPKILKDGTP